MLWARTLFYTNNGGSVSKCMYLGSNVTNKLSVEAELNNKLTVKTKVKHTMFASSTIFDTVANPGPHALFKKNAPRAFTYAAFTTF